ncbi:MAG: sulfate transporter, periplasmic sulfate-binding protein [Thermoleophilia bacterium]|nr:sulfate transporter, periplasmic sulfate-binding protein [Thermoleophilia bacterium]
MSGDIDMRTPYIPYLRLVVLLSAAALLVAGCASENTQKTDPTNLTLVAYSTPREAFAAIIPKFQKTTAGSNVTFDQSYGPSGDQSRAVESGLAADVVNFSLEPDVTRLVDAGLIARDWAANEHKGMATNSIVVLVVRRGNPKHIRTWDDLLAHGVEVVTPNPFTSGGARWNLMAADGAWRRAGVTDAKALANMRQLLTNTRAQPASAREALQVFAQGKGDVLIAYENEALMAKKHGEDIDIVTPDSTILIENPAAVVTSSKSPTAARAFLDYVWSDAGQRIFGEHFYRPVSKKVFDEFHFAQPEDQFTIDDLGGWDSVTKDFFDRTTGKVATIEQQLDVNT